MGSESYGDEESDEYDEDYYSEANDTVPAPNDKRKSMQSIKVCIWDCSFRMIIFFIDLGTQ